jgi:hypothetical protein
VWVSTADASGWIFGQRVALSCPTPHNRLVNDDGDHRQHPRFRLSLQVVVDLPTGEVTTHTVGISRTGLSVRLSPTPALEEAMAIAINLPDGHVVSGRARCRGLMPGCLCGMSLEFDGKNQARWDNFVDEEESTGPLWRMIGRIADAPDDVLAPRGITVTSKDTGGAQRFHTAGENGLAWRMAFHKQPSDPAEESDLCVRLPGFREPGRRLVRRVLREDVTLRLDADMPPFLARIVELNRGGYAYVQTEPVAIVSLGVGELFLVERDGASEFPHFTPLELEQIACDTFRNDLTRPMFSARTTTKAPPPVLLPPLPGAPASSSEPALPPKPPVDTTRFREGFDAVRFAQTAADVVQTRRYGDRDIFFHPSVWAKVTSDEGELMGPTMQDEGRVCVLALVGPGAPRVVRLTPQSKVSLLKPPR